MIRLFWVFAALSISLSACGNTAVKALHDNADEQQISAVEADACADLDCPDAPKTGKVDPFAPYGYGAGVTGGQGGKELHFDNGKALQTWLIKRAKAEKKGNSEPVIIWLSGTFLPGDGRNFSASFPIFDVKRVSNISFIGTENFLMDRIGFACVESSNIIIRNINFLQPKADDGADAVSIRESDGVWVDHCTFTSLNQVKDYEDGSCDITLGSRNVTVSWCRFINTQKTCLVGHSPKNTTGDENITATFHHNWFDGSSSRHPRARFGKVHVYNNLYDECTTYGVGSASGAKVLVEFNYFNGVRIPTDISTFPSKDNGKSNLTDKIAGYLYPTCNYYANRPEKAKNPYPLSNTKYQVYGGPVSEELSYADFKPSYDYIATPAEDVLKVVKDGAGFGRMGIGSAPIPVDNGGIDTTELK